MKRYNKNFKKGFTLIEMIVALGVFSVIALISLGSFLVVLGAQRKSVSIGNVQENLRLTLEMMAKEIRVGRFYYCGNFADDFGNGANYQDCANGGPAVTFRSAGGTTVYRVNNQRIEKSKDAGSSFSVITFPEVRIDDLTFYVSGSRPYIPSEPAPDTKQPKVTITVKGTMGIESKGSKSEFNIQTTVSQRKLDL